MNWNLDNVTRIYDDQGALVFEYVNGDKLMVYPTIARGECVDTFYNVREVEDYFVGYRYYDASTERWSEIHPKNIYWERGE